jgi:hypothetical protein
MKNISLFPNIKSGYIFAHPVPPEGRIMIVTIVRLMGQARTKIGRA